MFDIAVLQAQHPFHPIRHNADENFLIRIEIAVEIQQTSVNTEDAYVAATVPVLHVSGKRGIVKAVCSVR